MVTNKRIEQEIVFFSKNVVGGVQSYYYNIITNDPYNEFRKKWILANYAYDTDPKLPKLFGVCEEVIFNYGDDESIYEVTKRLNAYLSNTEGIIIPGSDIELATLHLYPKPGKTIFFVCHEQGSVDAAIKYEFMIDVFIAHNPYFDQELKRLMPKRQKDIFYLPYGVNLTNYKRRENKTKPLVIIFIARLQKSKGVYDLPLIAERLSENGVEAEWIIVGDGPEKEQLKLKVGHLNNFKFEVPADNEGVLKLAAQSDVFILPSVLDGLPVAMLEAMSVGVVPMVYEFNPGIKEVITDDVGFVVSLGDRESMIEKLKFLNKNRERLEALSRGAYEKVRKEYSIKERTRAYYDLFREYKTLKKPYRYKKIKYGHFVHRLGIPKGIRKTIKRWITLFRNK